MSRIINTAVVSYPDLNVYNTRIAGCLTEGRKDLETMGYLKGETVEEIQHVPVPSTTHGIIYTALITWREKL